MQKKQEAEQTHKFPSLQLCTINLFVEMKILLPTKIKINPRNTSNFNPGLIEQRKKIQNSSSEYLVTKLQKLTKKALLRQSFSPSEFILIDLTYFYSQRKSYKQSSRPSYHYVACSKH